MLFIYSIVVHPWNLNVDPSYLFQNLTNCSRLHAMICIMIWNIAPSPVQIFSRKYIPESYILRKLRKNVHRLAF